MGISVEIYRQSGASLLLLLNRIGIYEMLVERGKPENPEKNPRSKDENQQINYDAGSEIRTRATLVEGKCSHHPCSPNVYVHLYR